MATSAAKPVRGHDVLIATDMRRLHPSLSIARVSPSFATCGSTGLAFACAALQRRLTAMLFKGQRSEIAAGGQSSTSNSARISHANLLVIVNYRYPRRASKQQLENKQKKTSLAAKRTVSRARHRSQHSRGRFAGSRGAPPLGGYSATPPHSQTKVAVSLGHSFSDIFFFCKKTKNGILFSILFTSMGQI